jgi:tyrosyl-tRNA synthetase
VAFDKRRAVSTPLSVSDRIIKVNKLIEDLQWRGLLKDHTDLQALSERLDDGPITLYCGYDPTADSLHMGNLQMVVMLRRFQLFGHKVIALSGGGTGLIGDPSGRSEERQLKSEATVEEWTRAIADQLKRCLVSDDGLSPPTFVDNKEWIVSMSAVQLLRDVGKHFTVSYMLAKDSVSTRLNLEDGGLSFTEFSYMLLQAIDFAELHRRFICELQIGGSDQWGNITAGITLIKKKTGQQVYGLTCPLILRSDGKKFGKSESGAIWLARNKTSPYALYQYFMNVPDNDAETLLKRLTLLSQLEIEGVLSESSQDPSKRLAQKKLAEEVVRFVHGPQALHEAEMVTGWLFGDGGLPEGRSVSELLAGAPTVELERTLNCTWNEVLVMSGITSSKSEARRLIQGGGVYVWSDRLSSGDQEVSLATHSRDDIVLLSKGKKSKTVLKIV